MNNIKFSMRKSTLAAIGALALGLGACATSSGHSDYGYGSKGVVLDGYSNGHSYVYSVRNEDTGEVMTISQPASAGVYNIGDAVWIDNGAVMARPAGHGYAGGYNSYEMHHDLRCMAGQACAHAAPAPAPVVSAPVVTSSPCVISTYDDCGTGSYAESYSTGSYTTDSYTYDSGTTYSDSYSYGSSDSMMGTVIGGQEIKTDSVIYADCDLISGMNCNTTTYSEPTTVYEVPSDSITWSSDTTTTYTPSSSVIYTDCSQSDAIECRK